MGCLPLPQPSGGALCGPEISQSHEMWIMFRDRLNPSAVAKQVKNYRGALRMLGELHASQCQCVFSNDRCRSREKRQSPAATGTGQLLTPKPPQKKPQSHMLGLQLLTHLPSWGPQSHMFTAFRHLWRRRPYTSHRDSISQTLHV